jgi:hypothetical protein
MWHRHSVFETSRRLIVCGALVGCAAETSDAAPPTAQASAMTPVQGAGAPTAGQPGNAPGAAAPPAAAGVGTPGAGPAAVSAMPPAGTAGPAAAPGVAPVGGVTYQKDIRPVVDLACLECHGSNDADRIGPFPLHDYPSVMAVAEGMVGAVEAGKMPPWPAAPDCREIADNRSLPPETRALFTMWKDAGYPEGDPASYVAPAKRRTAALGEPTLILQMQRMYSPAINDEYTCFGLADESGQLYTFPERQYMLAVQVLPGVPSEVHHVQLHRTGGAPAAGPVSCAGIVNSVENMFSWRPGSTPLVYPDQSAAEIPAGAGFTIQVHYNATFAVNGTQPDQTRVAFWFQTEGAPMNVVRRQQIFGNVSIPAGNPDVRTTGSGSVGAGSAIVGISPHAHMLATEMTAAASVNGQDNCLINIPKWDFHWQLDYMFAEPLMGPAQVRTTCAWNNSAENQPIVNGMQLQPRTVAFGEGSFDEMCLHYIWTRTPL